MDWALVVSGAGVALNAVVIGFWKPWLSAYGSEKGKNLARKEDLNEILAEVRYVTAAQKGIESKLSGDLWSRQMLWNERKTVHAGLFSAVHNMLSALGKIKTIESLRHGALGPEESARLEAMRIGATQEYTTTELELIRLTFLASIFADDECGKRLSTFLNGRKSDFSTAGSLAESFTQMAELNEDLIALAKKDLRVHLIAVAPQAIE